jgi:hypothetical protein
MCPRALTARSASARSYTTELPPVPPQRVPVEPAHQERGRPGDAAHRTRWVRALHGGRFSSQRGRGAPSRMGYRRLRRGAGRPEGRGTSCGAGGSPTRAADPLAPTDPRSSEDSDLPVAHFPRCGVAVVCRMEITPQRTQHSGLEDRFDGARPRLRCRWQRRVLPAVATVLGVDSDLGGC